LVESSECNLKKVPLRFLRGMIIFLTLSLLLSSCALEPEEDELGSCEDDVCVLTYSGSVIDGKDNQWSVQVTGDTVVIERLDWYDDECSGSYRLVFTNDSVSSLPRFESCTYTHFQPGAYAFTTSMKTGTVEIQDWDLDGVISGKVSGFGEPYDSFAFLFSFWAGIGAASEGEICVYIDPIQCLGNPWERAWLTEHDDDYDAYPRDEENRMRIFREFFKTTGVTIHEVNMTIWAEEVCTACSCPTGERIHCLIDEDDLLVMKCWGFQEEYSELSEDLDSQDLYQSWLHSWEEEQEADTIRIYRPSNYIDFPGGWFRMKYIFYENGECEWLYLAPTDGHYMKPGKWEISCKDNKVILIYDTADNLMEPLSFRIIELKKDILRIVPAYP